MNKTVIIFLASFSVLFADVAPAPPAIPELQIVSDNEEIKLIWDNQAENSIDPLTEYSDFEGYRIYRSIDGNRDDLILWYEDFESGGNGWSFDAGWEITEISSNSPTHSMVSPNNNSTLNGSFNLLTPQLLLPEIGEDETMYFGFAAHHLTQPNQGFISISHLPTKYTVHIGGKWALSEYQNDKIFWSPNILYQQQQEFQQFNYGLYINRGPIVGGLWARNSLKNFDAFILMFGLVQDAFKFGYSYDINSG